MLVDPSFGRKKRGVEAYNRSIVLFKGQKDQIMNLDETDGSLVITHVQRRGRSSFAFHSNDISGAASQINKTYCFPTIIAG